MVHPRTLQKYSLFGGLTEEQIESILPLMEQEHFDPEYKVISEGTPNDKICFIIEGTVSVIKGEVILTRLGEGEEFGEMEVLDVMPSVATIQALTPVTVISISNKILREIYKIDIKIFSLMVMNLARDLSRRLRKADEKIAAYPGRVL
ncbi:MAG: cyclic nucleotide-binding domain-containing protein [Treponema sp.]|jgi:CRP-like cAMP-binding protein|nr:cyclic nucleotide-binding domain-containing protein [Treponema sp.]